MVTNHSIAGGTSARAEHACALKVRALVGSTARACFCLGAMLGFGSDVGESPGNVTPKMLYGGPARNNPGYHVVLWHRLTTEKSQVMHRSLFAPFFS